MYTPNDDTSTTNAPVTTPLSLSFPQERVYPAWNWVCLDVELGGDHMMDFLELAMYMQGENAAGDLMQLTIPVMMQRRAGGAGAAMCAPLPASHQTSLPAPLNDDLRLVAVPQTSIYVRGFGGIAKPSDWAEHAGILQRQLTEDGRRCRIPACSAQSLRLAMPPNPGT